MRSRTPSGCFGIGGRYPGCAAKRGDLGYALRPLRGQQPGSEPAGFQQSSRKLKAFRPHGVSHNSHPARYNGGMSSLLIIDDEEPIAWALRRAFERAGHRVTVAASAEDGLAKAKQSPPDAVFLDVRLPGMDGLTALGELKKRAPAAAVVVITAHGNLEHRGEGRCGWRVRLPRQAVRPGPRPRRREPSRRRAASTSPKHRRELTPPARRKPICRRTRLSAVARRMQSGVQAASRSSPRPQACVLVTGESGTGKGTRGPRRPRPQPAARPAVPTRSTLRP